MRPNDRLSLFRFHSYYGIKAFHTFDSVSCNILVSIEIRACLFCWNAAIHCSLKTLRRHTMQKITDEMYNRQMPTSISQMSKKRFLKILLL